MKKINIKQLESNGTNGFVISDDNGNLTTGANYNDTINKIEGKVDLNPTVNQIIEQPNGTSMTIKNGNAEIVVGNETFSYIFNLAPNYLKVEFDGTKVLYSISVDSGVTFKTVQFDNGTLSLSNTDLVINDITELTSISVEKVLIRDINGIVREINKDNIVSVFNTSSYFAVAFVSPSGNNTTAKLNSSEFKFATINAATQACKNYMIAESVYGSVRCKVNVDTGVYNEYNINRNYVDMEFAYKAIVITSHANNAIISDTNGNNEPLNINITGRGEFYHTLFRPANDQQAIATNNSATKNFYFECEELDGIQNYGSATQSFFYKNLKQRFKLDHHQNKTITYDNCKFLSSIYCGIFICLNTTVYYNNCEVILPSDDFNSLLNVYDITGAVVATITYNETSTSIVNTSVLTRSDVKNLHNSSVSSPQIAGVYYIESSASSATNGYKVELNNLRIRIRKDNCVGIMFIGKNDYTAYPTANTRFIARNIHIEDETVNKTTTAVVAKKLLSAVKPANYSIVNVTSNCTVFEDNSAYEALYGVYYSNYKRDDVSVQLPQTTDDGKVIYYDEPTKSFKLKVASSGISEAPNTINSIYGRSGELSDWVEALPLNFTKNTTINVADKTLTINGSNSPDYLVKYISVLEDSRYLSVNNDEYYDSSENTASLSSDYKYQDETSTSDGISSSELKRTAKEIKLTVRRIINNSFTNYVTLDESGLHVPKTFVDITPTENVSLSGKKILLRDNITGEIQSVDVTNLGLGDTNYKGYYLSESALTTAYPSGQAGWHAYVDLTGEPVQHYAWDGTESAWVSTGSVQTILEVADTNVYLRTLGGWIEGIAKSTYDAFISSYNSTIATITSKLNKYPSTTTINKFIKGNGTEYIESDIDWTDIQNKPTTFTPSAHTHVISDVTALQTTLDIKENIIVPYISKPDLTAINPTTERRITVSISSNQTLSFSRVLVNGESGVINLLNTTSTSYSITLPTNSISETNGGSVLYTTGLTNARDRMTWEYDGVKIWWTYSENYA